jgi:hypothetical protein
VPPEFDPSWLDAVQAAETVLPLTAAEMSPGIARPTGSARELFPEAGCPEGALAGALLYLGYWEDAHNVAQELHSREGSYWHAIIHRLEPDSWNSMYWFRQTGRHAIFSALAEEANWLARQSPEAGWTPGDDWDPGRFVDYCESARSEPDSPAASLARSIQLAEWRLLFHYCERTRW